MVLGLLVHVTPSNFFRRILRSEALVYKSYFFRTAVLRKLFDIIFSYNHCNLSHVCQLVKMASKTVTRSIALTVLLKPTDASIAWILNTECNLYCKIVKYCILSRIRNYKKTSTDEKQNGRFRCLITTGVFLSVCLK